MFCKLPLVVFRYGNLPRGFPTPELPLASRFTGHVSMETKTGWVKKEGKKVLLIGDVSQFGKWDFPRLDYLFFRIFFPGEKKEGHALLWRWMSSSGLPQLPAAFRAAALVSRLQCCDLWPLCCYRGVNLVKRKCFLMSGAGRGAAPSWLSPFSGETLRDGLSSNNSSLCLCRHLMMLLYFIPHSEASLKSICKGFEVLAGHLAPSLRAVTATPSWAGTETVGCDEDIKPKVHRSQLKANPKLQCLQGEVTALLQRSRIYGDGAARSLSCILIADVTHQVSG